MNSPSTSNSGSSTRPVSPNRLKALLLDVDGVLTDNGLYIDEEGRTSKRFDVRDGQGVVLAQRAGLQVGLISGHDSKAVRERAQGLGISICFTGVKDKIPVYEKVLEQHAWSDDEIAYVGDDLMDLGILGRCGFAATVADAHPLVREIAHFTTRRPGGFGAVRELIEHLLKARGQWTQLTNSYREPGD
ncbi:MAG: HAD-IIIA family hydrolase [Planctomycetota bacterium]